MFVCVVTALTHALTAWRHRDVANQLAIVGKLRWQTNGVCRQSFFNFHGFESFLLEIHHKQIGVPIELRDQTVV